MCSLLALHEEVINEILHYCTAADLKNVSVCNRTLYHLAKKKLWRSIKVPWRCVTNINWRNSSARKQVENLKYTKRITFYDQGRWTIHKLSGDGWDPNYAKKYLEHLKRFLSYCNPETVAELGINRGGDVLNYACETFPKLKKIHLEKMLVFPSSPGGVISDQVARISHMSHLTELHWDSRLTGIPVEYQHVLFSSGNLKQLKLLVIPSLCCHAALPYLQQLKLTGHIDQNINIDYLSSVASSLQNLDLSHTSVTAEELQKLPRLHRLEFLSIGSCFDTYCDMEYISTMDSLKFLDIEGLSTDQGLLYLQKLTKLKGLVMSSYVVDSTDVVVQYLMKMNSLVYLDITSWGGQQLCGSDLLSVGAVKKLQCHQSLKRLATYYTMKTFGGSCGNMDLVKSKHACYDVWRSGDDIPDKVESRFLDPDGWQIQALEKLIE